MLSNANKNMLIFSWKEGDILKKIVQIFIERLPSFIRYFMNRDKSVYQKLKTNRLFRVIRLLSD